jgi:MYXO-CTERM domain-containing protein
MRNREYLLRLRTSITTGLAGLGILLAAGHAEAAEWYVSPTGSDSNAGSLAAPFATLQKGNDAASAGDTIWVRAGTYSSTKQIVLSKSGTSDSNRTKIWAYQNEAPILDCSKYQTTNAAADVASILVTGNWMHLRGLEIANGPVGPSGAHSISMLRTKNSSNNTFERLNIHHGFGPGLFIDTGTGGNLILNCDSHDNYDKDGSQGDGQNGDGFGVHYQTTGPSTVIRGCRAWLDSDDGYDFISQEVPITIEDSFAIQCGYANGGATSPSSGNGNGFKIGSSLNGVRHIVRNNVAWKNKAAGFYANHSTGGNTWYNNTSYMNGSQYNMLASSFDSSGEVTGTITLSGSKAHIMRNNIGFPNKNTNMTGVDSGFNTWDLNITEAATDFVSTSDTGCTGPREADGSLPADCTFLKLKAGSPLIDKGTDVALKFTGAAPDLGAYEYGAVPVGTGGTGGVGGSAGGAAGGTMAAAGATETGGRASGGSASSGGSNLGGSSVASAGGAAGARTTGTASGGTVATGGSEMGGLPTGGTSNGGTATSTGGTSAPGSSASGGTTTFTSASVGAGGASGSGGNSTAATAPGAKTGGGCGCRFAGTQGMGGITGLMLLAGLALAVGRRRRVFSSRTEGHGPGRRG